MYKVFPKICSALIRISELLFTKGIAKEAIFTTESPLRLTEAGLRMLEESGFYQFYNANKEHLFKLVKFYNPKTPYDVEEAAKKVMLEIDEKLPHFNLLKSYAYHNGIPIAKLLFAYALYFRDQVLKELEIKER